MGGSSSTLTRPQVNKAKEVFSKFYDENGDGRISKDELRKAMTDMGENVTDEELEEMFSSVDADGNGTIDIKEFLAHNESRMKAFSNLEELKEAFRQHDTNGDGVISRADFDCWLKGLIIRSPFRAALDELIFDDEGKLNFEEYCAMMARYSLGDQEMNAIAAMGDNQMKEMSSCGIAKGQDQNKTKALS